MYPIEKGIPCPYLSIKKEEEEIRASLLAMEIGDSIVIPHAVLATAEALAGQLGLSIYSAVHEVGDRPFGRPFGDVISNRVWVVG